MTNSRCCCCCCGSGDSGASGVLSEVLGGGEGTVLGLSVRGMMEGFSLSRSRGMVMGVQPCALCLVVTIACKGHATVGVGATIRRRLSLKEGRTERRKEGVWAGCGKGERSCRMMGGSGEGKGKGKGATPHSHPWFI